MKAGRYIGVMSGTSLDGVDVVLAEIDDKNVIQLGAISFPFSTELKNQVLSYMSRSGGHLSNNR